jgi:hypothetical protein
VWEGPPFVPVIPRMVGTLVGLGPGSWVTYLTMPCQDTVAMALRCRLLYDREDWGSGRLALTLHP